MNLRKKDQDLVTFLEETNARNHCKCKGMKGQSECMKLSLWQRRYVKHFFLCPSICPFDLVTRLPLDQ